MVVNTCTLSDWMFSFIEYKEKLFLKLKIYYVTFIKVQQVFWIEKQDKKKTTRFDLARLQIHYFIQYEIIFTFIFLVNLIIEILYIKYELVNFRCFLVVVH